MTGWAAGLLAAATAGLGVLLARRLLLVVKVRGHSTAPTLPPGAMLCWSCAGGRWSAPGGWSCCGEWRSNHR
ncbi:hypothetical protein ABT297_21560 [Dactylosporangium sp. NPDC000555]|uniref:hypothetical protein n=1 Tax=Dactylosporangium sp. NPDC000555 TaxID=3154260 RepID=UPI003328519A